MFQVLLENLRKWRHFLKNTTRVEIIIAINTAVRMKNNKNFGSYIHAIFYINCIGSVLREQLVVKTLIGEGIGKL